MDFVDSLLAELARASTGWIVVFAILTALELAFAREKQSIADRVHGIAFWALWIPASVVAFGLFHELWRTLGVEPLVTLPLTLSWTGALAAVAAPIAGAFVGDFFFYWFHRAQHAWFWRFHAVHHSIRDLSAVNSYHHISESALQAVFIILPTSLIVSDIGAVVPAMSLVLWLHIVFLHSPTKLNFGPLRAIVADNRFHRIHHSLEPQHFDKNFAAFGTFWDCLFGTAYFPGKDEWPAVGLAEIAPPRNVREWLDLPSRYRRLGADPAPTTIGLEPSRN